MAKNMFDQLEEVEEELARFLNDRSTVRDYQRLCRIVELDGMRASLRMKLGLGPPIPDRIVRMFLTQHWVERDER